MTKFYKTILIIEDDESQSNMLRGIFLANRYKVVFAENGLEALKVLRKITPDAIILDLMMPKMDGYEFYTNLRKNSPHKDIPVIVLSASEGTKDVERLMSMGASDYIKKPYKIMDLVDRVSKIF